MYFVTSVPGARLGAVVSLMVPSVWVWLLPAAQPRVWPCKMLVLVDALAVERLASQGLRVHLARIEGDCHRLFAVHKSPCGGDKSLVSEFAKFVQNLCRPKQNCTNSDRFKPTETMFSFRWGFRE